MRKFRSIIIVSIIILIVAIIGLGYFNSYIGYHGYNKDTYRRFSETIKESKERKVFIKKLNYNTKADNVEILDVFIEKGYRWGNSSDETAKLEQDDSLARNTPELPFQVVVSFKKDQKNGKLSVFSGGEYNKYSPFIPIDSDILKDTVSFNLILENKHVGKVKAWGNMN
ncbi:hypothetical protein [Aquimarina algiphila]|uniref:Uncharacterized protein n=1 Tax=Aquimarina algiphila TaxID=2047982 RepID=A0A554VJP4_9FLAO|nr:hypothetical protein [Aquimarina algiphila]TSE08127.1 hypothetical protein FOF46_13805 [Aquimarina algiphila]